MILRLGWLCGCVLTGTLAADDLTLDGGGHLTGTVRSINEASVVELISKLSPEPMLLKRGAVAKVTFSTDGAPPKPPAALVELANGDLLPANLEALDDRNLTITSPQAGRLEIPRESLKSLQLGILQRKVLYAGPRNIDAWIHDEGDMKNWVFEHDSLIANGPAHASKNLDLPQQFILRFTLKWQPKQMPNFQVYFADPLVEKGERCDRYYLQFGGAGLEIKREAAKGKRFNSIIQLNRNPTLYPGQQLQVELRVDRKGSRLHLMLNDEPEGDFIDPIDAVPTGSGITLVSNAQNGSPQEIRDIEVLEFDDARGRHRAEERGDRKTDSLISREDDRWSGHLLEIRSTNDGPQFLFKCDFQKNVSEIMAEDVSTVFFAAKDGKAPDPQPHPFILRLRGDGALRVASCLFTEDTVSAVHPVLGPLSLRRDGILAMERSDPKADPKAKTAPEP